MEKISRENRIPPDAMRAVEDELLSRAGAAPFRRPRLPLKGRKGVENLLHYLCRRLACGFDRQLRFGIERFAARQQAFQIGHY